jgi:transcriptional regulator with XRE-family HTH domain
MSKNENLKKITSDHPSNWLQEAAKKVANKGARKNSRKVALRVLQILRERGISQSELADRMDVSRQQVTKIVKGQENFTFETIDKLERALEVTLMTIGEPDDTNSKIERLTAVLSVPSFYAGYSLSHWDFSHLMNMGNAVLTARDATIHASNFDVPFIREQGWLSLMNKSILAHVTPLPWCMSARVLVGTNANESSFSEVYRISEQEFSEKCMS